MRYIKVSNANKYMIHENYSLVFLMVLIIQQNSIVDINLIDLCITLLQLHICMYIHNIVCPI